MLLGWDQVFSLYGVNEAPYRQHVICQREHATGEHWAGGGSIRGAKCVDEESTSAQTGCSHMGPEENVIGELTEEQIAKFKEAPSILMGVA